MQDVLAFPENKSHGLDQISSPVCLAASFVFLYRYLKSHRSCESSPRLNIIYTWRRPRRRWTINGQVHPRDLVISQFRICPKPDARCAMNCLERHTCLSFSDRACRAVEDLFRCLSGGRRRLFRVANVHHRPLLPVRKWPTLPRVYAVCGPPGRSVSLRGVRPPFCPSLIHG